MNGQVSVKKVLVVFELAMSVGISRPKLLTSLGLTEQDLSEPESWLSQSVWKQIWEEVIHQTHDDTIALQAAARLDRGYFGVIDYVARSSDTMADAITHAARYFQLANTQGHLTLTRLDGALQISRHLQGDEGLYLPRQAAEFALVVMMRVFQSACSHPWSLQEVTFRYPPPPDLTPYQQVFGCPVRFSAPCDALVVSDAVLALPMDAPDERLRSLITRHADELLDQLPASDDLLRMLRELLARELPGGLPGIDQVAAQIGMSRRTLQRQLAARGETFRSICDEIRHGMATRYLGAGMSQGEAAFLLGYAESSAFSRAFRRWTGLTPGMWQRLAPDDRQMARTDKGTKTPRQ